MVNLTNDHLKALLSHIQRQHKEKVEEAAVIIKSLDDLLNRDDKAAEQWYAPAGYNRGTIRGPVTNIEISPNRIDNKSL